MDNNTRTTYNAFLADCKKIKNFTVEDLFKTSNKQFMTREIILARDLSRKLDSSDSREKDKVDKLLNTLTTLIKTVETARSNVVSKLLEFSSYV